MPRALILPSPFLPGLVHAPLAAALERRGWGVAVAERGSVPRSAEELLGSLSGEVDAWSPDVLVTHSNAGRYASHLAAGRPVVHLDAALPPPSGDPVPMAPEALLAALAELAGEDGLLPPWTRWWPEEAVAELVPDPGLLRAIREGEPRVPLSYVRSRLGAPAGWTAQPQAYVAFGDTYAVEVALARDCGWPVVVLEGAGHLHHLVAPEEVAETVLAAARGTMPS